MKNVTINRCTVVLTSAYVQITTAIYIQLLVCNNHKTVTSKINIFKNKTVVVSFHSNGGPHVATLSVVDFLCNYIV